MLARSSPTTCWPSPCVVLSPLWLHVAAITPLYLHCISLSQVVTTEILTASQGPQHNMLFWSTALTELLQVRGRHQTQSVCLIYCIIYILNIILVISVGPILASSVGQTRDHLMESLPALEAPVLSLPPPWRPGQARLSPQARPELFLNWFMSLTLTLICRLWSGCSQAYTRGSSCHTRRFTLIFHLFRPLKIFEEPKNTSAHICKKYFPCWPMDGGL